MPYFPCCVTGGPWLQTHLTASLWVYDQLFGICDYVVASLKWDGEKWDLVSSLPGGQGTITQCSVTRDCDSGDTNITYNYQKGSCVISGSNTVHNAIFCGAVAASDGGTGQSPALCCDGHGTDIRWEIQALVGIATLVGDKWYPVPDCDCDESVSTAPVRYATGELRYSATDISSSGFSMPWGHTRHFTNQLQSSDSCGQGYNWLVSQWPYVTQDSSGNIAIMGDQGQTLWFEKSGSSYICAYDLRYTLELNSGSSRFILTDSSGTITEFDRLTGMFRQKTAPGGQSIQITAMAPNGLNFTAVERSVITGGVTTLEQFHYEYITPYADTLLQTVTLRRQVNGGNWINVTRANYTYYGPNESHGGLQDLKTAVTQVWNGTAWDDTGTNYYRYYPEFGSSGSSSSSSSGGGGSGWSARAHLLMYVLNPAAFERIVADGHDPFTVSDSTISQYADYFFDYNDVGQVIKETVKSGSQTFEFDIVTSGFSDDLNHWTTRTTETLPDGNQNIIYANVGGQTMLKVFKSGSDEWLTFWRYGSDARVSLRAHASAISGYDEAYPDLLHWDSGTGTYEYLRDHDGLIETFTYHQPSGNRASESLQQGQLGESIPVHAWSYCKCGNDCDCNSSSSSSSSSLSSSSGETGGVWFLRSATDYPDDSDPDRTILTQHCYSFYDGTCAVKQRITTLPVVPTEQNGSGSADTNRQYLDIYGNQTWTMNERGFITRMAIDIPTGAINQQVDDVDTSLYSDVPAGWSTPSGGGLNVITDLDHDDQGRTTQSIGPSHSIDLDGIATVIRTASWTVFDDENHITYSGQGFATGTAPDYEYTLINPVSITKMDASGRVNEQIQAIAPSTSGTLAEIIAAAGGGEPAFPQSSYTRWTTNQYTDCCLAASQRVYHTIPDTGEGTSGTNYDETDFGYDVMKRRNRTVSPGGTITDLVYEPRGLVIGTYVGTNDDGGTETDPTGGGVDPDNNMVIVTANEYDDGADGGDGNLTQLTQYVNATTTRVTLMTIDFRNRRVTTDGEIDYFQKQYFDNLDRVIRIERYDTTAMGNLIALSERKYDDQGRVYRSVRYGVDPATGTVGVSLKDNSWFDASGNVIKTLPSGSSLFTKTNYDSLGRTAIQYRGYDLGESFYADAFSVADDVIIEQIETIYDNTNLAIQSIIRQRYHNSPDTQTGPLHDPSTTPKARVTYSAVWQDGIGRPIAMADYGTNGGSPLSRPEIIPIASDTVLVNLTTFDGAGNQFEATDPAGMVTRFGYDDRGRKALQIDNYNSDSSSSSSSGEDCEPSDDVNRTTRYTFTPDGQQATMTAENWRTGDQTTTWNYGTTLTDSDIASSQLLRSLAYPDSVSPNDTVRYGYNRQGGRITLTDQRGCVHVFDYDKLGRQIHDRVTTVGDGVDDAVLRLSTTYEARGMIETLTSWNNASVTLGDAVNQCLFNYNEFGQLIADYQAHDGEVDTDVTPVVQYRNADGSANTIRQTTMTYPNGRVLYYGYGNSGAINDALSRIVSLIDDDLTTHLADYSFVGLNQYVVVDYAEPDVKYSLVNQAGANDPDTGDIYNGWDRFGRTKDCRWYDYGHVTDIVRLQYGYDRVSDRLWREDLVAQSLGKDFDELYSYDGLHRLKEMQRGLLNGTNTAITNETFAQCWSLDSTSNWHGFREASAGGSWTTVQSRTASIVNEVTGITTSVGSIWVTPEYDTAGNTTTIPQPADPTTSYTARYDSWNRMVGLVHDVSEHTVQQNAYDARNFRIIRRDYTDGAISETRHFYYTTQWKSIEERLDINPESVDPERQQVWGQRYIDDLILRDRDTNSDASLDERLYGLQDANWNVVALTDASAASQERYIYSPFGVTVFLSGTMTIRSGSQLSSDILFTGQRLDATSLHLFRTRLLHSRTGQFMSRDYKPYIDGTNLYAAYFVSSGTDPLGSDVMNYWGDGNNWFVAPGPGIEKLENQIIQDSLGNDCSKCEKCHVSIRFQIHREELPIPQALMLIANGQAHLINERTVRTGHTFIEYSCPARVASEWSLQHRTRAIGFFGDVWVRDNTGQVVINQEYLLNGPCHFQNEAFTDYKYSKTWELCPQEIRHLERTISSYEDKAKNGEMRFNLAAQYLDSRFYNCTTWACEVIAVDMGLDLIIPDTDFISPLELARENCPASDKENPNKPRSR